jgi:DNA-binding MarR family transcriptional regulator
MYTFFFSTLVGKQISKAVFSSAVICLILYLMDLFGFVLVIISPAALLTYIPFAIAMLVLWEKGSLTVKELGEELYLDSGTLTPLLKKLEAKGLITRKRSTEDERNLILTLTKAGLHMRDDALEIPQELAKKVPLDAEEVRTLYRLLHQILERQEG